MTRFIRSCLATVLAATTAATLGVLSAGPAQAADRYRKEIINSSTGRRADVMWASRSPYQGVFLWPDNASASQEFDLLDSGGGYFRIRARHSGQCLMLDWRQGNHNGTAIIQYPYCGGAYTPAQWRVRWLSGTRCSGSTCTTGVDQMQIVNRFSGRCLDARNPSGRRPPVRAVLQQWDCANSAYAWNIDNQAWDILSPGEHRID